MTRAYTANGLNQYTAAGAASFTYDANGNLTGDGSRTYTYDAENRLVASSNGAALAYDPLGRLYQVTLGTSTTRFLYDGDALVEEYNGAGTLLRRHAHWEGADVPVATFDVSGGTGLGTLRYLFTDHQGSIIAEANGSGAITHINTYDEYGIPAASNIGRFQYTGQAWLPELGMYYYKARIYSPTLGRFMQTDPVGFGGGMNIYAYVFNDPVNLTDPLGLDPPVFRAELETHTYHGGGSGGILHLTSIVPRIMLDMPMENGEIGGCYVPNGCIPIGPPPPSPPRERPPCVNAAGSVDSPRRGSNIPGLGDVWAISGELVGSYGFGGSISLGYYRDLHSGANGWFSTSARGFGVPGGGAAGVFTNFSDLNSFSGESNNLSGSAVIFGAQGSESTSGRWGHSVTAGLGTPRIMSTTSITTILSGLPRCRQ